MTANYLRSLLKQAKQAEDMEVGPEKELAVRTIRKAVEGLTEAERLKVMIVLHPFVLTCTGCDALASGDYGDAVAAGWQEIIDDDGLSWSFLGHCPDCFSKADSSTGESPRPADDQPEQGSLFPD